MNKKTVAYAIIALALLAEMPRFISISLAIEPGHKVLANLIGIGIGCIIPGGTAYIFHAWARSEGRARQVLMGAFLGCLALQTIMVTPHVMDGALDSHLADILGDGAILYIWCISVALAPLFVVAGVAFGVDHEVPATKIGRSGSVRIYKPTSEVPQYVSPEVPTGVTSEVTPEVPCPYGCGYLGTQRQVWGHKGGCSMKPVMNGHGG